MQGHYLEVVVLLYTGNSRKAHILHTRFNFYRKIRSLGFNPKVTLMGSDG